MTEPMTYSETRFACTCGRFLSESAIRSEDFRDDSAYYGVRTEVEWDCSRCGTVKGEGSWEPPLVVVGTRALSSAESITMRGYESGDTRDTSSDGSAS